MKVLKIIKNVILGILITIFFVFAITMTFSLLNLNDYHVTELNETAYIPIKEQISSDKYQKGDLVLVKKKLLENIKVGDEIFAYKVKKNKTVTIDIGVVGELHPENKAISFENGATYDMDYVAGSATKVYNDYGTYLGLLQSKWGFLFVILVPSFLIFVYELYALVVEIRYGKEEK